MNQRVSAILIAALLISATATYVVYRAISSRPVQQTGTTTQVIQAAHNLELGAVIKDIDLKTGPWAGTPPPGMAVKKETLLGRGVIAPIYEGEPIVESRLAPPGAGGGLAATIPPGMRAVAVRVNDIVGVAGFVVPGMRVDVLIAGTPPGGNVAGPQVKTLLQNIEVLSAGQNYQKDSEGKPIVVPVVNLLVTPEQAEILSLASNETRIQLVLRNPLDTVAAKVPGAGMPVLFGGPKMAPAPAQPRPAAPAPKVTVAEPPKATPPPPPPPMRIEVINGALRTETRFNRPNEEKQ